MEDRPAPRKRGEPGLRFIDAMPRPLLVLLLVAGVVAIAASVIVILRPPKFNTVAVQDRRPPPRGSLTHDVGRIVPGPLPSQVPSVTPPCPAVSGTHIMAGGPGVQRLRAVMVQICSLSRGGVPADVTTAIAGLKGATIRYAGFGRPGVESTADIRTKTIWLNIKFSQQRLPVEQLAPVVLHEGWHLANPGDLVTAEQELDARRAEVATCRQLIEIDKWPRWCQDARALTELPQTRAIDLLVSAGYRR
jgi:hypothetical protein